MRNRVTRLSFVCWFVYVAMTSLAASLPAAEPLRVLMLGDRGHHQPQARYVQIRPVLADAGIVVDYTESVDDLNLEKLSAYDALLLYANIDRIEPRQADALLKYVADGGGFIPLHCASYCFRNNADVVALMGAQFQRHGTGVFRTEISQPDHPIMQGFAGFSSWDETYVHHLHNEQNRTVLAYRVEGSEREPWTWVRTHGKGRVFYTAWGHDQRTWGNRGFQNLLERGIRWAAGRPVSVVPPYLAEAPFPIPEMTDVAEDAPKFEYVDVGAKIPNYTPGANWGTLGDAKRMMQKPLPPASSAKHMVTPKGFRVELFVSEPDLGGKPIAMAWDERGRLWVAETYDYPNQLQPPGKGRDRIRICEDTDGDWRADKFTVFAENLSIPTTLTFHRGGLIVQDSVETVYLKDTNGDDIADVKRTLFTGWNQGDTHGGVSNFTYGLDNHIWAMQGYNQSRPAIDGQPQQSFRMGFFRFAPDGSSIEFLRSTNNNTWGLGISEEGVVFGSTANRNPSVYMPIPNRYYERVRGWTPSLMLGSIADDHLFEPVTKNVRQVDQHGGYTAAAGHALYTARRYPREYWNRTAFVNGPTGHLVGVFHITPDGSDFRSRSDFNLLASHDEWTAPILSDVGPDGNVWVIDWYNYIVQHNPTPQGFETGKGRAYETDLRDKQHGRIYRVVYDDEEGGGRAGPTRLNLQNASIEQLVETLRHPTLLWRRHAQRLLVERGRKDSANLLIRLVDDPSQDQIGLNVGAIHALWTMHGLGLLDGSHEDATAAAYRALRHRSAGVRRNAVQVLPRSIESTNALLASEVLRDPNPQVRLMAVLALADLPPSRAAGATIAARLRSADAQDRWIRDAAVSAAANNAVHVLTAAAQLPRRPDATVAEAEVDSVMIVAEHLARGPEREQAIEVVAMLGTTDRRIAGAVIGGLNQGWPDNATVKLSEQVERPLLKLLERLPAAEQGMLVKLARGWGSEKFESYATRINQSLLAEVDDDAKSIDDRIEAARQLLEFSANDLMAAQALLERIDARTPPELAIGVVQQLRRSRVDALGTEIVAQMRRWTPQTRQAAVVVLLSRVAWANALLEGIANRSIPLAELSLDQRQSLANHPERGLRRKAQELLAMGGALPNPDRQRVLDELLPVARISGDAKAGKQVFTKQCAKCHRLRGEGQDIGPDLTGMSVHPKEELLVHILDPNRNVEGNYRSYQLQTADGRVLSGLLKSESRTAIELYDAEGRKQVVLREDIDELIATSKSLMPEGFERQVDRKQLTDLLEYLTQRGKFTPVSLASIATIASDRGMFNSPQAEVERLIFPDWGPKQFRGVPFMIADPQQGRVKNVILLNGPNGAVCRTMPRKVTVPCNGAARAIHLLSGVSGWGHPFGGPSVSMTVRLNYADGETEEHPLVNGEHFADYIRRVDVPKSEFAFPLRGQQIRYLAIHPKRPQPIETIDFIKGDDNTAPIVMAITIENVEAKSD